MINNLNNDNFEFELIQTTNGKKTIRVSVSPDKSLFIHSTVNPEREAQALIDTLDTSKSALYFVFGIGLGYHLEVLKKRITPFSQVVVIEPPWNYMEYSKEVLKLLNDERFTLVMGEKIIAEIDKLLYGEKFMLAGNCKFITHPAYNRLFGSWISSMQKQIISLIKNRAFEMGNDVSDTLLGIRQNMLNSEVLLSSPNTYELAGIYEGKPAVIVSAGPSLNKNVELLHKIKGKALILCVDAALQVLIDKGIIPDAIFVIERGIETYEKFFKNKKLPKNPVLIAPPVIHPNIFKEYPGKKIAFLRANEGVNIWLNSILEKGMIKMGTSVAHLAFGFAQLIKANPIIFIGQDLAYSPSGDSHADGVAVKEVKDLKKVEAWVEGYNGEKLPTSRVLKNFLTWFEAAISDSEALCIDATEGGAYIKGTKVLSFEKAINEYISSQGALSDLNKYMNMKISNYDYDKLIIEFNRLIDYFKDLTFKSNHSLNILEKALDELNKLKKENKRKLLKIHSKLKKNEDIVKLIINNKVATMCFQTMLFLANKQLLELGHTLSAENLKRNIAIQKWFLERVESISKAIVIELQDILKETSSALNKF